MEKKNLAGQLILTLQKFKEKKMKKLFAFLYFFC